jgi:predicted DNA binding CopG/RHH family protein
MAKFIPRKPEKEVISMRIAVDTLQEIDSKAAAVGISRNELLTQMISFALSNMDDHSPDQDDRPV